MNSQPSPTHCECWYGPKETDANQPKKSVIRRLKTFLGFATRFYLTYLLAAGAPKTTQSSKKLKTAVVPKEHPQLVAMSQDPSFFRLTCRLP